jgi:hypothetical protein
VKLHKDGTVEGTPQEIAEYNRLSAQPFPPLVNEDLWQKGLRIQRESNPLIPTELLKPVITSDSFGQQAMTSIEQQRAYGHAYIGENIAPRPMFNSDTKPE